MKTIFITLLLISCNLQAMTNLVSDVVMMTDSKISVKIIETYIKNVDIVLNITPSNIVYMTQHGVDNSIIELLINKNIESKKRLQKIINNKEYRESYDFFYENYLKKRIK